MLTCQRSRREEMRGAVMLGFLVTPNSFSSQVASRFGIKEFPAMVVAAPDGSGSGTFATWDSLKIAEK